MPQTDDKSSAAPEKAKPPARRLPFLGGGKRARAEEELAAACQRFQEGYENLTAALAEAVVTTDEKLAITGWNQAAEALYGWPAVEVTGKTLAEVVPTKMADGRAWEEELSQVLAQGGWQGEVVQRGRGGGRLVVRLSVKALAGPEGTSLILVGDDLTKQRQLAEQLNLSEAQFRLLADSLPQLIWMADAQGEVFWYNRRWFEYTGTTPAEMEGKGWQKVHNPDYLPRLMARISQAFKAGAPWEDVFPLRGKDGQYRQFFTRAVPLRNKEGRVIRWLGVNTDINEVRAAQQALRESEEKHHRLLANLSEGYILFEARTDAAGTLTELRYAEVNAAFERITGTARANVLGQALASVLPADAAVYLENVGRVLAGGQPQHFSWYSATYRRWFEGTAYLPQPGYAAVLFWDASAHRGAGETEKNVPPSAPGAPA